MRTVATLTGATAIRRLVALGRDHALVLRYSGVLERVSAAAAAPAPIADGVEVLLANPDHQRVAALSKDGVVLCALAPLPAAAFAPCGRLAAPAGALALHPTRPWLLNGTVDALAATALAPDAPPAPRWTALGFDLATVDATGDWIAAGARDGSVLVWRPDRAEPWAIVRAHERRTGDVALAPRGALLVTGGWDGGLTFLPLTDHLPTPAELEAAWGSTLDDVLSHLGAVGL